MSHITKYYFARPATVHGSLLLQVQKLDSENHGNGIDILYDIERKFHTSLQRVLNTLKPSSSVLAAKHHLHHFTDLVIVDHNNEHQVSLIKEARSVKFSNHSRSLSSPKELEITKESSTEFIIPSFGKWIKKTSAISIDNDSDRFEPLSKSETAADLYFCNRNESRHHSLYADPYNTNNNPFISSSPRKTEENERWDFMNTDSNRVTASLSGFELSVYDNNEAFTISIISTTVCLLMNIINNDSEQGEQCKEEKSKNKKFTKHASFLKLLHT